MGFFDKEAAEADATQEDEIMDNDEGQATEAKSSKRAERTAAIEKVIKYCEANGAPADVIEACKTIRPSYFGITRGGGGFTKQEFTADQKRLAELVGKDSFDDIEEGDSFDEMTAFQKLRFGRKDINGMIKHLIKSPGEKAQVWLAYDVDTGVTTVEAVGDMPEGWTGYVPKSGDAE